MTVARDYLARHQKEYPPRYPLLNGLDRAQQLFQNLLPVLPHCILDLFSDGLIAVGEVGRNEPDIQTINLRDNGFVIEFNSGMMDFDYAVARGLSGLFVRNTTSGPANQKALGLPEVTHQVARIFMQWRWYKRWIWNLRRIKYPRFLISKSSHEWTEAIANLTELFMLAHEVGHIALNKGMLPHRSDNDEEDADAFALKIITSIRGTSLSLLFAGSIFAIRIFEGLEKVGVRFSNAYPAQAERITNICTYMLSLSPSRQYYHEICRIAVAFQDMMDDVENHIIKRKATVKPNTDRIIIRLIAEILEVALERAPKEIVTTDIIKIIKQNPADVTRQIIDTLKKYYLIMPQGETFINQETREKMGKVIQEVLTGLPENSQFSLTFWQSQIVSC